MSLSEEQSTALDRWADIAGTRAEIEEFLDWVTSTGRGVVKLAMSRADLLDIFYSVDRKLLESARQELLEMARSEAAQARKAAS